MATSTKTDSAVIAGLTFSKATTYTNEGQVTLDVPAASLTAGQSGTLTTRTLDTTGVITIVGHGISAIETIDIVWSGGSRYNVDIDSVLTDTITFSGGAGDILPSASTAVTVGVTTNIVVEFDGDDSDIFAIDSASQNQTVSFKDSGGAVIANYRLISSNDYTVMWDSGSGVTNPLTGNAITSVDVSCDSTTAKFRFATLKTGV